MKIQNPKDTRFVKALIFSPSGHGKTHMLGTAQDDERTAPMLLLDFEGGDETLAGLDIDVAPIRSWDDYSEAYEVLSGDDHSELEGSSLAKGERYKSVGIDSISETHVWALLSIVERKGPSRREPDLVEQGDYGIATTQMRRLLREFRDLPLHVFYTAHAKEIEERGVGKVKVPAMAGQMAEEVVGIMSLVGYLATFADEEGGLGRSLILQNYPGFRTKVRMPWKVQAPDDIDAPDVTTLLDLLQVPMADGTVPDPPELPDPDEDEVPDPEPGDLEPELEPDNTVDIDSLTVKQLKDELDELEVEYTSSDRRPDLAAMLRDAVRDAG